MENKKLVEDYLSDLLQRVKDDKIDGNTIQKLYNVLYLDFTNCKLDKEVIDYTFLGWWLYQNSERNNKNLAMY